MNYTRKKNLIGQHFGLWTVIDEAEPKRNKDGQIVNAMWVCQCECGNMRTISTKNLKNLPNLNGCGCGRRKQTITENKELNCLICTTNTGKQFLFDACDLQIVKSYTWAVSDKGYVTVKERGISRQFHQEVMNHPAPSMEVDHINGNPSDNRRCNLRIVNRSQNMANREECRGKSGHRNVFFNRQCNKWEVTIQKEGKKICRMFFSDFDEACRTAEAKHKEIFGEYSINNSRKDKI